MNIGSLRYFIAAMVVLAAASMISACSGDRVIQLVPVFPNDEPNLMENALVDKLTVLAEPMDQESDVLSKSVDLMPQERLNLKLSTGLWRIRVSGFASSREVVHGETPIFRVKKGGENKIKFFVGRSLSFNEVALEPVDVANEVGELRDMAAVYYLDSNNYPWILITGGKKSVDGSAVSDAYLVDVANFSVERIASLSCSRAGHKAFVVDSEEGMVVVVAGGDSGSCPGDLDVFSPETQTFNRVSACSLDSTRGAVGELAESGGAKPVQNGWVIVPGNPRCKVNVHTGEQVSGPTLEDPVPSAPLQAAINPSGRILMTTLYELFVDTSQHVDTSGYDQCISGDGWADAAYWKRSDSGVMGRVDARLYPLEDERFLYIGGTTPGEPEYGWRIITAGECRLSTIFDGRLAANQPRSGFALLDLGPHDGGDIGLLAAGGSTDTEEAMDKVFLFSQSQGASTPTLHDLSVQSREVVIEMKRPRAGHVAVRTDGGDYWIFGGGASVSEVFVRGSEVLSTSNGILEKRSPTLTSVTVFDTATMPTGDPDPLVELFKDTYVDILYPQSTEFRNMLFFVASADLGVGDDLLGDSPLGTGGCEEDQTLNIAGTASGNVSNIDLPDDWIFPIDNPGYNIENVKNQAHIAIDEIAGSGDDCGWRQLLGAGVQGLQKSVVVTDPTSDDPFLGVNILFFVSAVDDCSQGVFEPFDLEPADPPSSSVLQGEYCSSEEYDEYFGLPPVMGSDYGDAFEDLVDELSWDPTDLLVVFLGNAGEEATCVAEDLDSLALSRPRRLLETMDVMDDRQVETVTMDLCEFDTAAELSEQMGQLRDKIQHRNPLQACLPQGVLDQDPEFDEGRDQYVPVTADKALAEVVAEVCQLAYLEEEESMSGTTQYRIAHTVTYDEAVDTKITWVGTDSDGRAHCAVDETPWVLRVDNNKLESTKEDVQALDLICLP